MCPRVSIVSFSSTMDNIEIQQTSFQYARYPTNFDQKLDKCIFNSYSPMDPNCGPIYPVDLN